MKKLLLLLALFSFSFAGHTAKEPKDIVDTAVAVGQFNTLVTAVQAAGLVDTLKSPGPFTVLAPTDSAFAALPEGTLEFLLQNIDQLTDILLYHVIPGEATAMDLLEQMSASTVLGQAVSIEKRIDGLYINDSKVVIKDVKASNGIIQVIDAVLLP